MKYVYALLGIILVSTLVLGVTYESLEQCSSLASEGKYIDAGLCYEQFKVWDKCTYYLLKGAREAEKEWNFNQGDWNGRVVALEYYGGAHTKACLQNYGDYDLMQKIDQYHEWLYYWLTSHADPPFDMDALLADLEAKIFGTEEIQPQEGQTQETVNATQPVAQPAEQPEQETEDNSVLVIAIVGLVTIAVLAVIALKLGKRETKEKQEKAHKKE